MNYKILVLMMIVILATTISAGCVDKQPTSKQIMSTKSVRIYDSGAQTIDRVHDDQKNVTCWLVVSGAITVSPALSCIADKQLE